MKCPNCGSSKGKVLDSRLKLDGSEKLRRRECLACSHKFSTIESFKQVNLRAVHLAIEDIEQAAIRVKKLLEGDSN